MATTYNSYSPSKQFKEPQHPPLNSQIYKSNAHPQIDDIRSISSISHPSQPTSQLNPTLNILPAQTTHSTSPHIFSSHSTNQLKNLPTEPISPPTSQTQSSIQPNNFPSDSTNPISLPLPVPPLHTPLGHEC